MRSVSAPYPEPSQYRSYQRVRHNKESSCHIDLRQEPSTVLPFLYLKKQFQIQYEYNNPILVLVRDPLHMGSQVHQAAKEPF